jgi:glycine dehydrogenase subunit 1
MPTYLPHTVAERETMLKKIGVASTAQLFDAVPKGMLQTTPPNIPAGKSELAVRREMETIAGKNKIFHAIFRGAGAYHHYIPAIVKSVANKEEFLTAYTPYQPEISQGLLQSIFEYQTMIAELCGMDVSNASVYDGATAAAEAVAMCRERRRSTVVVSATINPETMQTIKTYCFGSGADVVIIPEKDGETDYDALTKMLDDTSACVYMQQPNYFGVIENADALCKITHEKGAKFIMGVNPIYCALYKMPGEVGADIAVGEGQPLGIPMSFGGPYLGFMTAKTEMMRKLPGRIVGQTTDNRGQRAFVLTLQAREQHIRREKASSNICSNEANCALTAGVFMAAMGSGGMKKMALACASKAKYLADELCKIKGFALKYNKPFFHEFVTTCANPANPVKVLAALESNGILGGLPIDDGILWCATEMNTKEQIDKLISVIN